ncbi:hypothetical protein [Saccharomonospora cyanea]|uniref:Secreted protein n=1 Tax=Saccharomonospora cyanea NA-134 TaxID=882082 RepID=H5XI27_9PSEU|nr:hypothetical protein [Saccharomonospora cyanea]EHR60657.1 hypothetical protein SaccyDRAFT_1759 [Saccharomonospora cyanea NA-134]
MARLLSRIGRSAGVAALACAAALGAGTAAAQAEESAETWQVSYGSASASGTHYTENRQIVVEGELRNTGDGCYTLEYIYVYDFSGHSGTLSTVCGPGSDEFTTPVGYDSIMSSVRVYLCKGTGETNDCESVLL